MKQARKIMISPVRSEASASAIGLNVTTGGRRHFSMQGCTYRVTSQWLTKAKPKAKPTFLAAVR